MLDDAIGNRCACGCRQAITDRSPSAWFASERCHDRWHSRTAKPPREMPAPAFWFGGAEQPSVHWQVHIRAWSVAYPVVTNPFRLLGTVT